MICNTCRNHNPEGSIFCGHCGKKITHTESVTETPLSQKPSRMKNSVLGRGRIIALFSILILFGAIFYIAKPNTSSVMNNGLDNIVTLNPQNGDTNQNLSQPPIQEFKGIITGLAGFNNWTLSAYNPMSGLTATRQFPTTGFTTASFSLATSNEANRQRFNKDYTEMAVSQSNADGSSSIGYVDLSGNFTNLTPQTANYAGTQKQTSPVFNPVTGRIWFNTPTKLGSVDPNKGANSSQSESFDAFYGDVCFLCSGQEIKSFYLTPDGTTPVRSDSLVSQIFSPDGKTVVTMHDLGTYNLVIGDTGKGNTDLPVITNNCKPERFIDNTSFLCIQGSPTLVTDPNKQLYKITISADKKSITSTSLLPASDRTVVDALADQSGKNVAFIAQSGSVYSLYTIPISGGSEPHKVADFGATLPLLLSWEQ